MDGRDRGGQAVHPACYEAGITSFDTANNYPLGTSEEITGVFGKSAVTVPVATATKDNHIDDAVAALDLDLGEDEVQRLEAAYSPRRANEI